MKSCCLTILDQIRCFRNRCLNIISPPLVVLLYHRVADLEQDPHQLAVSPQIFREQLRYLKDNFPILSLDADWSRLKEPSVAISFDDGYADNYLHALPVLKELSIPATFFITSGYVDAGQEFWWDELERLLIFEAKNFPRQFQFDDKSLWDTDTLEARKVLAATLHSRMKTVAEGQRELWLSHLREWSGASRQCRPSHRPLSRAELKSLAASPWVTIGAHTVTHTPLVSMSRDEQLSEITMARQQLEEWTGSRITLFSYPFGTKADYTAETVGLVATGGFHRAFSNIPGQVHPWSPSYELRRNLVRNWPVQLFVERVAQFWTQ